MQQIMRCIYCTTNDATRFGGVEHVIPQSFGTFGSNTPTLSCVCDDCNGYFGRSLDQNLARETLEGVSRYTRGQPSSERRLQRRLEITLGDGPETGAFAGMKVFVDGTTGMLMPPSSQFHVFNFRTNKNEVYFQDQVAGLALPEAVYGRPRAGDLPATWRVKVFAPSKDEHDSFILALNAAGIAFEPGEPFQMPDNQTGAEVVSFPVHIEGAVDALHKRALAKILMNFVAWSLGYEEAMEPRWNFLRNYVRNAQGLICARISGRPFWNGQESENRRFVDDSIDVRLENLDGNIVGAIQFYGRSIHEMILVEGDALEPRQEVGYRFTPGQEPIRGEKRPVGSPQTDAIE